MIALLTSLVSIVLLVISMARHPTSARCPDAWFVNGIRPSGHFTCLRKPTIPEIDCTGAKACPEGELPEGELTSRIYCTGGSYPIVVDDHTVGCQR